MSELLERLKQYYIAAKRDSFEWRDYYPNNMPNNGKEGIYTCTWFVKNDRYELRKYTIQYQWRVDADGMRHTDEEIKYYILHEFVGEYDRQYGIPAPTNDEDWSFEPKNGMLHGSIVNELGRFRYVFDDEETAKKAVSNELLHIIYPYTYALSEKEGKEWNKFILDKG